MSDGEDEEVIGLADQMKDTTLSSSKHPQEILNAFSFFLSDYEEYIHRKGYWEEVGGLDIHIRLPKPAFSIMFGRNFERISFTMSRNGATSRGVPDQDSLYEDMLTWSPDYCPAEPIIAVIVADMLGRWVKLVYNPMTLSGVTVWDGEWNHGKLGREVLAECLLEDHEILFVRSRYDLFSISRRGIQRLPAKGKLCYEIRHQ